MHYLIMAKARLKKKKSNAIILILLIGLATTLLYTSIGILTKVDSFIANKHTARNGADIFYITDYTDVDRIKEYISKYKETARVESSACYSISGKYGNPDKGKEYDTISFIIGDVNEVRDINALNNIVDGKGTINKGEIVVPYYFKSSLGYKSGDTLEIQLGEKSFKYKIYGFSEDIMISNPTTISMYYCYLTKADLDELDGIAQKVSFINIKVNKNVIPYDFAAVINKEINEDIPEAKIGTSLDFNTINVISGLYVYIIIAIMAAFGVLILIISILVIRFSIISSIEEDMVNIGILQAQGYTTKQLIRENLIEFLTITFLGLAIGIIVSLGTSDSIGNIISSVMGLNWQETLGIDQGIITIGFIAGLVTLFTLIVCRRYKKLSTLDALRGGIANHSFRRNPLPLNFSIFGLNTSIGLKNIFYNLKQNIAIALIIAIMTFTCITAINIYYNFAYSKSAMINLVGVEKTDIEIAGFKPEDMESILNVVRNTPKVQYATSAGFLNITLLKGDKNVFSSANVCEDFSKRRTNVLLYGSIPQYKNEIMLTTLMSEKTGAEIGDTIYVQIGKDKRPFVVCGIAQCITNSGNNCYFTTDALKYINKNIPVGSIFVYLNNTEDIEGVIYKLKDMLNYNGLSFIDYNGYFDTIMGTLTMGAAALCIVFTALALIVIVLIITLLIRMKLVKDAQLFGIYKAIGYTTPQIILQNVYAYVPVVTIGTILGGFFGYFGKDITLRVTIGLFTGLKKNVMVFTPYSVIITLLLVMATAIIASILGSLKVRLIEPVKMIKEL